MSEQENAVLVRQVTPADAEQLRDNCFSANTLDQVQVVIAEANREYERGAQILLVAESDGVVVGTGTLIREEHALRSHRGELIGLVIHPDHRHMGVARQIVEEVRDRAVSMGLTILEVGCRGGTPAEGIYPRLGFVEYGRLPGGLKDPDGEQAAYDEVSFYMPLTPRD